MIRVHGPFGIPSANIKRKLLKWLGPESSACRAGTGCLGTLQSVWEPWTKCTGYNDANWPNISRPSLQQGEEEKIWKKKASCKTKKQEASQQQEEARGNRQKQPEQEASSESARRRRRRKEARGKRKKQNKANKKIKVIKNKQWHPAAPHPQNQVFPWCFALARREFGSWLRGYKVIQS